MISRLPPKIDTVNDKVDIIDTNLDTNNTYTKKIDNAVLDGLLGVEDSLGYTVNKTEHHLHNFEYWIGAAVSASGETHIADEMGPSVGAFALQSGDNAYGSWVQIIGSSDLPIHATSETADAHRVMVTTTNSTEVFHIQFIVGESSGLAGKVTTKDYTGMGYIAATNNADSGISEIMTKGITVGTKVWARTICIGQDAKTINFYLGLHEYVG